MLIVPVLCVTSIFSFFVVVAIRFVSNGRGGGMGGWSSSSSLSMKTVKLQILLYLSVYSRVGVVFIAVGGSFGIPNFDFYICTDLSVSNAYFWHQRGMCQFSLPHFTVFLLEKARTFVYFCERERTFPAPRSHSRTCGINLKK